MLEFYLGYSMGQLGRQSRLAGEECRSRRWDPSHQPDRGPERADRSPGDDLAGHLALLEEQGITPRD